MASRAQDLKLALTRTKVKIRGLEKQVHRETGPESGPDCGPALSPDPGSTWISKELRDSLVDMYKANPRVNEELRHRLPSPGRSPRSPLPLSPRSPPRSPPRSLPKSPPRSPKTPTKAPTKAPVQSRSPPRSPGSHRSVISPDHTCPPAPPSPPRSSASPIRKSPSGPRPGLKLGPFTMEAELKSAPDRMEPSTNQGAAFQDRDKNITFLLKELDSLRDLNTKLQEQLVQKEKELQERDLDEPQTRMEQEIWTRTTEVVEQLMEAQKRREQAMMSRLRSANEERDQALLAAQRLTEATANHFSVDPDSVEDCDLDVLELLDHVCAADSVQQMEQFGSVLVQRVRSARQRRSDITAQEMSAVMDERDVNAAKVKRLEEELRERLLLQAELVTLQRERDAGVGERRRLEAELQELRANHRRSEAPPTARPTDDVIASSLPDDVTVLQQQLVMMSQQKQSSEAELVLANEKIRRLERLVEVLRKKVGTGSARAIV